MKQFARLFVIAGCVFVLTCLANEPVAIYRVGKIEFKDNGRLDPDVLAACDVRAEIRKAAERAAMATAAQTTKAKPQVSTQDRELNVEIEKVAKLPWGSFGASGGGAELGVSAFLSSAPDNKQQFVCRIDWTLRHGINPTQCLRIAACSRTIAENIKRWVAQQE